MEDLMERDVPVVGVKAGKLRVGMVVRFAGHYYRADHVTRSARRSGADSIAIIVSPVGAYPGGLSVIKLVATQTIRAVCPELFAPTQDTGDGPEPRIVPARKMT